MKISLVVAAAANSVIGSDGGLPWHLPNDFKYFKRITMGKPIVMGRRTWESIGRPLPGRQNVVLTRDQNFEAPGVTVVNSADAAIAAAGDAADLMIIGGGQVYAEFLDMAERVYLTRVATRVAGDTVFPELDGSVWRLVSTEAHAADDRHAFDYEFRVYERRPQALQTQGQHRA